MPVRMWRHRIHTFLEILETLPLASNEILFIFVRSMFIND